MDKKKKLAIFGAVLSIIVAVSKGSSVIGRTADIADVLIIFFAGIGIGVFIKSVINKKQKIIFIFYFCFANIITYFLNNSLI